MLSYRHGFHAGNFADVFKHIVLAEVADYFTQKPKPFVFFDTHAGEGFYHLNSEFAQKTGEFTEGIIPLLKKQAEFTEIPSTIARYIDFQKNLVENYGLYGGSSLVVSAFSRTMDEAVLCELHPTSVEILKNNVDEIKDAFASEDFLYGNIGKLHVHKRDGYECLQALTPPKSPLPTRGFAFIDPSYEVDSDFENVHQTVAATAKKWNGTIVVWYPVLERKKAKIENLIASLQTSVADGELLQTEFHIPKSDGMTGSGMFMVNPPYLIEEKIENDGNFLCKIYSGSTFNIRTLP